MTPCRVCELVDGDATPKETAYCSLCQAWLCTPCRGNYGKRTWAAILERTGGRHANSPA